MLIDSIAWIRGDIANFMESIDTVRDVEDNIDFFISKNRPHRKHSFINALINKLPEIINKRVWIKLITQDDNMELFLASIYNNNTANNPHFFDELAKHPACCWAYIKKLNDEFQVIQVSQNVMRIFRVAIEYCINLEYQSSESILQHIKLIWKNVTLIYRFSVIEYLCDKLKRKQLEQLYIASDIKIALASTDTQFKFLPLINIITDNLLFLEWSGTYQVQLLNEIYETDMLNPETILNKTMTGFLWKSQRDIWRELGDECLEYYYQLNWTEIDDEVIPCHDIVDNKLIKLLIHRGKVYDYEDELADFCTFANPGAIINMVSNNLVKFNNPRLWKINNHKQMNVLLKYWLKLVATNNENTAVTQIIIDNIGKHEWYIGKAFLLSQSDNLIKLFPGDHQIFKVLLREPLPSHFKPSQELRYHIFEYVPSLLNLELYNQRKQEIINMLNKFNTKITDTDLVIAIINDIIAKRVNFSAKVLNSIPLNTWRNLKLPVEICHLLISVIDNAARIGQITYNNNNVTTSSERNSLNQNIMIELCYKSNHPRKLPSPEKYIQYIILHYGTQQLTTDLINYILINPPMAIVMYHIEDNYENMMLIYQYYKEIQAEKYIIFEQRLLMDLINYYPNSPIINEIFIERRRKKYSFDNEILLTMQQNYLTDHCARGLINIKSNQMRFLNTKQRKMINNCCAHCNAIMKVIDHDHIRLPCGHHIHNACYEQHKDDLEYCCRRSDESIYNFASAQN